MHIFSALPDPPGYRALSFSIKVDLIVALNKVVVTFCPSAAPTIAETSRGNEDGNGYTDGWMDVWSE